MLSEKEAIQFINIETDTVWKELSKIYNLSDLKKPEIIIELKYSRTAGSAYYTMKKVSFNLRLCMIEGKGFYRTICHELAHIVQFYIYPHAKQGHGPEFRNIMFCLDQDGATYHSYNVKAAKSLSIKSLLIDTISIDEM